MEQKYIDFVKSLEKAKIVKKGSHKNEKVMETVKEVCNMTKEEVAKQSSMAVVMIHSEYTDWVETYKEK